MGMRGYASGVLTSPTVVIPFWLAATRDLNARVYLRGDRSSWPP
jgi:hypothetical protein